LILSVITYIGQLRFYQEEVANGPNDEVVADEFKRLIKGADAGVRDAVADALAYMSACAVNGTYDAADATFTGDQRLHHYVELSCRVAVFYTVIVDASGDLQDLVVLKFCKTLSAYPSTTDTASANQRLRRWLSRASAP